jgi:glutamine amidotransferase
MSRLLGYICSDDSLTPYAIDAVRREAWQEPAKSWAATGFGWVQESRTLLRKHPSNGDPVDMLGLLADVPARALVGHMSDNADVAVDSLDLQPFRFRKWVFAQTGAVPEFDAYRAELLADTPDHLRRGIQGNSAAEVVFHRFYHSMCRNRALVQGRAHGELVARALASTIDEIRRHAKNAGHEGSMGLNIVAATERLIVAARTGSELHVRVFEGIEQPGEEPLFAGHRPKKVEHPHFRAAFLAGGLAPSEGPWSEIEADSVAWIDESWQPRNASLDSLLEPT